MFGYKCITKSRLADLLKKEKDLDDIRLCYDAACRRVGYSYEQISSLKLKIDELDNTILEYKKLYLEEVEKRLALAKAIKEAEE